MLKSCVETAYLKRIVEKKFLILMESRPQPQRRLAQFKFFFTNTLSTNEFVKKKFKI
jgi:hypothetical protein